MNFSLWNIEKEEIIIFLKYRFDRCGLPPGLELLSIWKSKVNTLCIFVLFNPHNILGGRYFSKIPF